MKLKESSGRRAYSMGARAQSAAETGERILDSTVELFWEMPIEQITLDEVARRSEVTVQTVIRRFGGKDGLIAATTDREREKISAQRDTAPVGDVNGAVHVLVDHYEVLGDRVLKLLADEGRSPALREILDGGRRVHRDWCARVFAPALAQLAGVERSRRLAQLVAVCDVYTWKLLRRDAGLSRRQTELALIELLLPLTKEA